MFKKKEIQKIQEETVQTTEPAVSILVAEEPNLTHTAMTIYRLKGSILWSVAEVKFDPNTGATGEFKVLNTDTERVVAEERFRIGVVEKVFTQKGE